MSLGWLSSPSRNRSPGNPVGADTVESSEVHSMPGVRYHSQVHTTAHFSRNSSFDPDHAKFCEFFFQRKVIFEAMIQHQYVTDHFVFQARDWSQTSCRFLSSWAQGVLRVLVWRTSWKLKKCHQHHDKSNTARQIIHHSDNGDCVGVFLSGFCFFCFCYNFAYAAAIIRVLVSDTCHPHFFSSAALAAPVCGFTWCLMYWLHISQSTNIDEQIE